MKREDTPFIHCIQTPIGNYVYDVNTGNILSIQNCSLFQTLKYIEDGKINQIPKDNSIKRFEAMGYFSTKRPLHMQHNGLSTLQNDLDRNIRQITLQVTQQCNFRCTYCTYAPKDFHYQREHSSKQMPFELAQNAIQFLYDHSIDTDKPCIGFYGGEPLLQWGMIEKLVLFAETLFSGKDLMFTITTNGSLLNEKIVDFMSRRRNFHLMISLDGSPKSHDRSRKYMKDGSGTFSVILRNLRIVKEKFPDFFQTIRFNVVIDPRFSYDEPYVFYDEHADTFDPRNIQFTIVDDSLGFETVIESETYFAELTKQRLKVILALLHKYPQAQISKTTYYAIMSEWADGNKKLDHYLLPDTISHSGPCIPGQRRLFVDVEGNFYPCERVSETSACTKIGDLYHGFDYEAAGKILNIASLTEEHCKKCWAIRLCSACIRHCDNNGELSGDLKRSYCPSMRKAAEAYIRSYIFIQEHKLDEINENVW